MTPQRGRKVRTVPCPGPGCRHQAPTKRWLCDACLEAVPEVIRLTLEWARKRGDEDRVNAMVSQAVNALAAAKRPRRKR